MSSCVISNTVMSSCVMSTSVMCAVVCVLLLHCVCVCCVCVVVVLCLLCVFICVEEKERRRRSEGGGAALKTRTPHVNAGNNKTIQSSCQEETKMNTLRIVGSVKNQWKLFNQGKFQVSFQPSSSLPASIRFPLLNLAPPRFKSVPCMMSTL